MSGGEGRTRLFHTRAPDAREAVREFHAGVVQPDMELVVFFCSSRYDLEILADEMARLFAGVRVVGCTTAGEFGPAGYGLYSLAGASFPAGRFTAAVGLLGGLGDFAISEGRVFAQWKLQQLEKRAPAADASNSFGLMLIDGLSVREEPVTHALQQGLGGIPLIGGSAGDDLEFRRTGVYFDGAFHADCAVLALVSTPQPLRIFKTQHFVAADERMVVTAADAARRAVHEINGLPAAAEYARIMGMSADSLDPMRFAASPVAVRIGGNEYVRSIQKANPDGSLTFYCAIEEGVVLRRARGVDMLQNLEQAFDAIRSDIGAPELVIGCDCILRSLEASQNGIKGRIGEIYRDNNAVGFNSYGEQYLGVHVNQTLTGVAIGQGRPA